MASGTLYTFPDNFRAFKALIAAQYSGADVKISPGFKFGETNKSKSFLEKFPLGKVPAFESASGDCLFESNAIAQYVSNAQLMGANSRDAAFVQQWINFADNEVLPASCTWVFPCLGIMQFNKQETEKAKEQVKKALGVLNGHLSKCTFLVGERISQADISVACNLLLLYKHVLDPSFRAPYIHTNRWFTTLVNQPQFSAVIGPLKMCSKMAEFDSKKFAEFHGQQAGSGKKEKQPKPAAKKKEKEAEPEEEEEEKPKESKDPFASFPKGTFNMDEFKREYSNKDTLTEALPYFWKNFDKENFSIWFCEYKYNDELAKIFMTSNLIRGMFQRLEKLNKNAFASMCIFGEDNKNSVSGIWVWRGQQLAFEFALHIKDKRILLVCSKHWQELPSATLPCCNPLFDQLKQLYLPLGHDATHISMQKIIHPLELSPDWQIDYESYSWKKLDPASEETKNLVKEYFAWEGNFDGKKFNQGKVFK